MDDKFSASLEKIKQMQIDLENEQKAIYDEAVKRVQELVSTFHIPASKIKFDEEIEKTARRTIKPKYKSPDGVNVWSGRGRQPAWVSECLNNGYNLDDLLVEKM